jgi:predicted DNA-binding transcriptional regulator YafY
LAQGQTLTELKKGTVRLVATVPDTLQLRWWLLGFGEGVEVIEPKDLRERMVSSIQKMQGRYGVTQ